MISKEDFNKVWKDSTREAILNQYYYDYMELQKVYSIIKEAIEYIKEAIENDDYLEDDISTDMNEASYDKYINSNELLNILQGDDR